MSAICTYNRCSVAGFSNLFAQVARPASANAGWRLTASRITDMKMWLKGTSVGLNGIFLAPLPAPLARSLAKSYANIKDVRSLFILPSFLSNITKLYKGIGALHKKVSKSKGPVWTNSGVAMQVLNVSALSASAASSATKIGIRVFPVRGNVLDQLGLGTTFLGLFSSSLKIVGAAIQLKDLFCEAPHSSQQTRRVEKKKKVLLLKLMANIIKVVSCCLSLIAFFTAVVFCSHLLVAIATLSFCLSLASRLYKQSADIPPRFSKVATLYH